MNQNALRRKDAAKYLQENHSQIVSVATLDKLASIGGGPGFFYAGRYPLYPTEELDRWAEARTTPIIHSTSERAPRQAAGA